MREIVLDPNGSVLDPSMLLLGTMLPVSAYVTRTPAGEVVQVLQIDTTKQPQPIWNVGVLG